MLIDSLSEEGHLLYLQALQTLLPLLPVSENTSKPEVNSDSEDDDDPNLHSLPMQVTELTHYINIKVSIHELFAEA